MVRKVFLIFLLFLSACSPRTADSSGAGLTSKGTPVALASTTFLADIARNVAGDRLQVKSLLPFGTDPHSYQATPQDVAMVADSNLLIINGANYEVFLETVLENAGGKRKVIDASAGIKVREGAEGSHSVDPHLWMDPNNVIAYVRNIHDGLSEVDPDGAEIYTGNAEAYIAQLKVLDAWIREQVSSIPAERRLLVTNHESLGYFADRYGFTVVGTVVPGFSSDAAPSAKQMADLIDQVKATGAAAIFLDIADSPVLADQIASEVGVPVVNDLYIESLTDDPPAGTYLDMMKHDVLRIVEALK